jgi:glycerol-3-phosphate acyltransferase PlsY
MTHDAGNPENKKIKAQFRPRELMRLPGVAAISLYLLLLAGVVIVGVATGNHYPPLFLIFSAVFLATSAGLLLLLRWAWALALAAVFLLVAYDLWIFSSQHQVSALVQGLLNLVFFLYLVRPEVRGKLR